LWCQIMQQKPFKIYCAGPLFNPSERQEMSNIAQVLKKGGYDVFLPQEDGLEFARLFPVFLEKGVQFEQAQKLLNKAIFALDVFQVRDSRGLVLNMNGRVPDEGAIVEASIAWVCQRPIVIFNSDARTLIQGNNNPLVLGLSNFETVDQYENIPKIFDQKFSELRDSVVESKPSFADPFLLKGQAITNLLKTDRDTRVIVDLLLNLFGRDES